MTHQESFHSWLLGQSRLVPKFDTTLALALTLDVLAGEPPAALHPVVWLGKLIAALERYAPPPLSAPHHEVLYGAGITALTVGVALLPALLLERRQRIRQHNHIARMLLAATLLKTTCAFRMLLQASGRVAAALEADDLDTARIALRWLVSRDTSTLDASLIAAATIESLAENASDSVIAPICFYALFGLPGACAYRAVNTLDAMIGYRERYEYLGKVPARLDDVLNLLPARLTALLIVATTAICGGNTRHAWQAMWRDHTRTASPNAGWPMSAIAGALGVQLEKVGHYCVHAEGYVPTAADIRRAERIVGAAVVLGFLTVLLAVERRNGGTAERRNDGTMERRNDGATEDRARPHHPVASSPHHPVASSPHRLIVPAPRRPGAPSPRTELEHVPSVTHGGYHDDLDNMLDFSANINPAGPSPRIWHAMQRVSIGQHPDPRAMPLRRALAEYNRVAPTALLVGNGAVEIIYLLTMAYVRPHDRVVIVSPTFGEYAKAATIMGAEIVTILTTPDTGFALDSNVLIQTVQQTQPRLLFLCNPNNPTGTYHAWATVQTLLTTAPDTLLVLDEAFINFVPDHWDSTSLLTHPNVLILRSMTKDYALTGLRVGYAIGTSAVIAALEKVQPPWSVNALAQAAALAALEDEQYLRRTLAELATASTMLRHDLTRYGFAPLPSATHFFLLPVPSAAKATRYLHNQGILVRDATSFGLPLHIRVASRQAADNAQLITALAVYRDVV